MTSAAAAPVYRSFLEFDPYHAATRGLLIDAQKAHRLTMSPFAYALEENDFYTGARTGHPDHRATYNILWAVNHSQPVHPTLLVSAPPRVRMILQSDIPPDFDYWRCHEWTSALLHPPSISQHTPTITAGRNIEYQIVIHPRRNITVKGIRKTVVATHDDDIHQWWLRKSTAAGLTLNTHPDIDRPHTLTSQAKHLSIKHFRLTGKATITDPARYAQAAHLGIGASRAYGCGLLLTK
ncbi:type I-E CRISPR-associated protein Cas6/Cse3/CasE [Mycobacterium kansasii]